MIPDFDSRDFFKRPHDQIAEAISKGDEPKMLKLINSNQLDINLVGIKAGLTLLIWAVMHQNISIIKTLLVLGADPNQMIFDPEGKTSLRFQLVALAAQGEDDILLETLVDAGGDVNSTYNGEPALFQAFYARRWDRMRYLLDKGADIDQTDTSGVTPIIFLSMLDLYEQVHYLLERGADFKKKSLAGIDVCQILENFQLPLHSIEAVWQLKVKQFLVEKGIVFN